MANILVVDDDKEICDLLKIILNDENHNVFVARDGQEGIFIYNHQKLDLIITDIIMPNKDGIDLIMEVIKVNNSIPIIAMSGGKRTSTLDFPPELCSNSERILQNVTNQVSKACLHSAVDLGVKETLRKPFSTSELLEAVNHALKIN